MLIVTVFFFKKRSLRSPCKPVQSLLPQAGEKSCAKHNMPVFWGCWPQHKSGWEPEVPKKCCGHSCPEGGVDLECQYLFNVELQNFESEIIYMDNFHSPLDFCTWRKSTVARQSVEKEKTCARESSPANLRTMETIKSLRKNEFVATAWWDKNCLLVQIFFRFNRTN